MNELILSESHRRQIEAAGASAYPEECCGILFGRDGDGCRGISRLSAVSNNFESTKKHHRFSISPRDLMAAEKSCGPGERVVGIYHSHPDHPARPSEYDRQHAWPYYSYVIVAIENRTPAEMTSWTLNESTGQFEQQRIREEN